MARNSKRAYERRAEARRYVNAAGRLDMEAGPLNAQIIDLSEGGFSAELSQPLMVGSEVTLSCPQVERARATVIWEKGSEYGFSFDHPVAKQVVEEFQAAPGVIWVDFKAGTVSDGPTEPISTQKFSGAARIALALSLGIAAWGAIGGIGWIVIRLLR